MKERRNKGIKTSLCQSEAQGGFLHRHMSWSGSLHEQTSIVWNENGAADPLGSLPGAPPGASLGANRKFQMKEETRARLTQTGAGFSFIWNLTFFV